MIGLPWVYPDNLERIYNSYIGWPGWAIFLLFQDFADKERAHFLKDQNKLLLAFSDNQAVGVFFKKEIGILRRVQYTEKWLSQEAVWEIFNYNCSLRLILDYVRGCEKIKVAHIPRI
jgi:hypothetical protein